jgi:hypothetical protein
VGVLLFAALFLSSVAGHAQTNDGDEINRLRREAYQAITEQRLMDAFKTLSRLFEAKGWLWDACNGGRLAYRLGKLPEAHRLLSACDELGEKANQRTFDVRDKRILKESRNDLALVRTQVARLTIHVNKPGAELFVDGSKIGISPFHKEIGLEPGAHHVKAVFGDVSVEREYKIGAGELRITDLALHDPPPFEAPRAPVKTAPTKSAKTELAKTEPAKTAPPPAPPVSAAPRQWPSFLILTAGVVEVVGASFMAAGYTTQQSEYGRMQKSVAAVRTTGCTEGPACDKYFDAGAAGDTAGAVGKLGFALCTLVASGLASAGVIGLVNDSGSSPPAEEAPSKETPVRVEAAPTVGGFVIRGTF